MNHKNSMPIERRAFFERFPLYVWICFLYFFAIDFLVFYGTRPLLPYLPAHDLSTPLDRMIPLSPPWIVVYVGAFLSWVVSLVWIMSDSRERAYRLCGTYTIIMIVCTVCFLAFPVTIERPEVTGDGLFEWGVRLIYRLDSPTNLFPSLHVIISYLCWRFTIGAKRIPKWYMWFNLVYLILVCFSILFVKQHFIADIGLAFIVAEGAVQLARLLRIERIGFAIEKNVKK